MLSEGLQQMEAVHSELAHMQKHALVFVRSSNKLSTAHSRRRAIDMKLIRFLFRYSRASGYSQAAIGLIVLMSIVSGVSSIGLITIVNAIIRYSGMPPVKLIAAYLGMCLVFPLSRIISESLLIRFSQRTGVEIRMHLCQKMVSAPLRVIEEVGVARLLANLTDDILTIANALTTLPLLCVSAVMVVCCLIYLVTLSLSGFLVVAGFLIAGTLNYILMTRSALKELKIARREQDTLFGHFRSLLQGAKELRLHRGRRDTFLSNVLAQSATSLSQHNTAGLLRYISASIWGNMLLFFMIGLLLLGSPAWSIIAPANLVGFILTVLYLMTPLTTILAAIPGLGRANISVQKLEDIIQAFATIPTTYKFSPPYNKRADSSFQLELSGVTQRYIREADDSSFVLGPISLTLFSGELVFLVGGNGSGKTTLAKTLVGLYQAESGKIRMNGKMVNAEDLESYRENFSAVFSDFHLFESLLGIQGDDIDARAEKYLQMFQLDNKVQVKDGMLSTTNLSQGQRKRLALLTAYMEDRPFYVFDEWAADQDRYFKDVFYLELLSELKKRHKAVLVISHDDSYYHVADRIVKLENGQIVSDTRSAVQNDLSRARISIL